MWTEECCVADSTRGAASELGGKRLKSNGMDIAVDEARRGSAMWCMAGRAVNGGAVYVREV